MTFFDFPIKKQSFCADLYNVLVLAKNPLNYKGTFF